MAILYKSKMFTVKKSRTNTFNVRSAFLSVLKMLTAIIFDTHGPIAISLQSHGLDEWYFPIP